MESTEVSTPRSARRSKLGIGRSGSIWNGSGGSGGSGSGSGNGSVEYTSLRDVLVEGGGGGGGGGGDGGGGGGHGYRRVGSWREYPCHNNDNIHEFDASNIGIRNQLLKHAASAYLQSAVVVAGGARDEGCCLGRLWRRLRQRRGGGDGGGGGGGGGGAGERRGRGRGRVLMRAAACSWQGCVDEPAELCAALARRVAAFFAGIWT